jgi:minichromosome maintenance protein 10
VSFRKAETEARSILQVPLSPTKPKRETKPNSPARVLLGIDKGLRAKDVSLKRAASARKPAVDRGFGLSRSNSVNNHHRSQQEEETPRLKSFSERMLESRASQKEKEAKDARIKQGRSNGFGLVNRPEPVSHTFSHTVAGTIIDAPISSIDTNRHLTQKSQSKPSIQDTNNAAKNGTETHSSVRALHEESILEPYSGFHLRNRRTEHNALTRTFSGKALFSIPRLLKEVKSPEYDPPDCETDYVVLGIVAKKSAPLDHKNRGPKVVHSAGSEETLFPKFMVIHLTDLKWELDLFLFDTGFDTFWKITPGTVIAILNPMIMPPRNKNSGAFSLKLSSSEDTVLEIGTASDLGFCKAIKRDGKECLQWIDARKTEFCEFHISLKVDKARKGRMEFNTMVGGGTTSGSSKRGGRGGAGARFVDNGLKPEGRTYDRMLHETMYLAPRELGGSGGFNATRLLDDQDADVNAWQRGCSKEEWLRQKQKKQEREADLAKRLSEVGSGAGSDYLKARVRNTSSLSSAALARSTAESGSSSSMLVEPRDAQSLGLLGKKAEDVTFTTSGNKRKRAPGPASEPVGWGGAYKRGLLLDQPLKSTLKDPSQTSPKKNARFILEKKGIRVPGRESLGAAVAANIEEDSDDDLEIV